MTNRTPFIMMEIELPPIKTLRITYDGTDEVYCWRSGEDDRLIAKLQGFDLEDQMLRDCMNQFVEKRKQIKKEIEDENGKEDSKTNQGIQ